MAEGVRNLLEHNHQTDSSQHPLDDGVRHIIPNRPGTPYSQPNLNHATDDDRSQERFIGAQCLNRGSDNHDESSGRATDADL